MRTKSDKCTLLLTVNKSISRNPPPPPLITAAMPPNSYRRERRSHKERRTKRGGSTDSHFLCCPPTSPQLPCHRCAHMYCSCPCLSLTKCEFKMIQALLPYFCEGNVWPAAADFQLRSRQRRLPRSPTFPSTCICVVAGWMSEASERGAGGSGSSCGERESWSVRKISELFPT